ncbi:MAG: LysR family transcriptional regulator [Paracoccaceae bacterium]
MRNQTDDRFVSNLDWNLLRTFVVIVEEGGISRAANRLLRGQPAISLALQRLESELNCRVIERGRGTFRLTAEGRKLYQECVDIYGGIAQLKETIASQAAEISGEITIFLASHVVTPLLDQVLTANYRAHPKVTYTIKTAPSADVANRVQDKTASIGICLVSRRLPDLDYQNIYREFFGFYCGPPHPLFGKQHLRLDDLRDHDAVSFYTDDLNDALRPVALFRQHNEMAQRIVGRSSHLEELRRMIQCGLGVGPLPLHVAKRDVRDGLLWQLPPYKNPPMVDIFLVTSPRKRFNRAELVFIDALKAAIQTTPLAERTYS